MNHYQLLGVTLLLACAAAAHADPCALQGLEISQARSEKLAVFTAYGDYQYRVTAKNVLPGKIIDCASPLGLVLLESAEGIRVWVDPIDLALPSRK
jgi:hypothetical protein